MKKIEIFGRLVRVSMDSGKVFLKTHKLQIFKGLQNNWASGYLKHKKNGIVGKWVTNPKYNFNIKIKKNE